MPVGFHLIEAKFDVFRDERERLYFKKLKTSFRLDSEDVDKLRDAARRVLVQSEEFQRFLNDMK